MSIVFYKYYKQFISVSFNFFPWYIVENANNNFNKSYYVIARLAEQQCLLNLHRSVAIVSNWKMSVSSQTEVSELEMQQYFPYEIRKEL